MPLTPIDVQQKTFGTALRGYDLDEVDDFLDDVVTSLKDYEQRLRDAQERISTLEMEMTDRGDAEGAIARALVAAQRSADSIIADARVEAEQIKGDAHAEASELSKTRDAEKATAEAEIARIRGIVDDLRGRLSDLSAAVGVRMDEADSAIADATRELDDEMIEAAVTEFEKPPPTWGRPTAAEELDEYDESVDDDELDESQDSFDDSDDSRDDSQDSDDEEELQVEAALPSWATADDDETPVRPWEVG